MGTQHQPGRFRTTRRLARVLLASGLVLELLYLAGANAFLATQWGRDSLNRRPETLAVSWQRAWSWMPGLLHVRGLEVHGRARRAEWRTTIERGRMVVVLPALLMRHFRILRGQAHGAEIEIRMRPAVAKPRRPGPGRPWRVSLDGLVVDSLRRLRVNDHEIRGAGQAAGWARFQVRGPVALELTTLSFENAVLLDGGETAADALRLDGRLRVEPFVVGEGGARDLLAAVSGVLRLDTEASSLGFLAAYLEGAPWLRLGGSGHLTAEVAVAGGRLAPGSRLALEGPTVTAELFGLRATGEGRLAGVVPAGSTRTELTVQLPRFAVSRQADRAVLLEGENLELLVTNDSNAIDRPAQAIALGLVLPPARVPDLAAWSTYLPEAAGLSLTGGTAEIEAELGYSTARRSGDGWLRLHGRQVEAAFGAVDLRADVVLDGRLSDIQLEEGRIDLAGTSLEIDRVSTREKGRQRDSGWWGRMRLAAGRLALARGGPPATPAQLEGEVTAELRDTGPLLALLEQQLPRLSWLDGVLTVHDVTASTRLRIEGPRISLADLEVSGGRKGRLEILGQLDLAPVDPTGLLFARWGRLSAAVSLAEGERNWKLTRSRRWYDEKVRAYRSPPAAVSPSTQRAR